MINLKTFCKLSLWTHLKQCKAYANHKHKEPFSVCSTNLSQVAFMPTQKLLPQIAGSNWNRISNFQNFETMLWWYSVLRNVDRILYFSLKCNRVFFVCSYYLYYYKLWFRLKSILCVCAYIVMRLWFFRLKTCNTYSSI